MARERKDIETFDIEEFMASAGFSEGAPSKPLSAKTSKGRKAKAAAPATEGAGAGQATKPHSPDTNTQEPSCSGRRGERSAKVAASE